ncbi:DNA polymerase III subunit alpha [Pedobacter glucosidilyticus]|uniref:DNA polymerase III subunit alpha n=1 Tax=Pedobacter glucosidilyticus TaxID=1122941 RepID=UPI00047C0D79|nr:DNA polymerase III subunit alpha [Pedobacter glucosidilyticus]
MYLHCQTYFSFLYGTIKPQDLVQQARAIGLERLVVADINNTSAIIECVRESKGSLDIIPGIDFRNGVKQQFIGIAKNEKGFEELNRLLSSYLKEKTTIPERCPYLKNSFVVYPFHPDKVFTELQNNEFIGVKPNDLHYIHLSRYHKIRHKMVLLHTVCFNEAKDWQPHKLLRCIDENTILSKMPELSTSGKEVFLDEMAFADAYQDYPQILAQTAQLLYACKPVDFKLGQHKNKAVLSSHLQFEEALNLDFEKLKKLTYEGAKVRYKNLTAKIENRIKKELNLIKQQRYVSYFLINHEIISFANRRGFYYIGRGSGVNSIVAYCLKITDVDPIELDLYFERFMNVYRKNPPDFDIDFSWQDRDEIIQFIFDQYGTEHTCLQATYTTFQVKSATRELGKVYGLPLAEIEEILTRLEQPNTLEPLHIEVVAFAKALHEFPRNLSIHAGGILISEKPIYCYTATSHPPKGFPISQFDMYNAEDLGLYKFDILSQRGLGHIKDTISIVQENRGVVIDIHDVPRFMKDKKIIEHLERGNLMGCFYVESPAMRMLLAKLACNNYLTLVAASSIIRPGVAQSGMMREYVLRHQMPDKGKSIAHPTMWGLMKETYGIMVYQEDVIKVAHEFAQLDLAEADVLRRGMSGKYRSRNEFLMVRDKYFKNCQQLGYEPALAAEIWRQIESFAGYSFAKGHSASFAVESYQSMFLKAHFPLEFMVGVINNAGGFYQTEFYVHEARKAGARVELPCVNQSHYLTHISNTTIYLGFRHIVNLEDRVIENILYQRQQEPYISMANFVERTAISLEQTIILVRIGAFRFTQKSKQALLWEVHFLLNKPLQAPIQDTLFRQPINSDFNMPPLHYDERNDMLDELEILGFTIHPPFKLIDEPDIKGIKAKDIPEYLNQEVQIIGHLVTTKYARTKHGVVMYFGTFLDEDGNWIDTVLFPDVAAKYTFKGKGCYLLKGKVTAEFNFYTLEVNYMRKLHWWNANESNKKLY